ncbi:MAG TPA: trypsin-like peptidase domain-containing protein [Vicinamibacteria bacterium]|nr:trypsin-like peptidase domain-containing protein [Vicinamibacteria bacterium]
MTPPASRHSWPCHSCGRRVPAHIEECRCGAGKPHAPLGEPAGHPGERLSLATRKSLSWQWVGWGVAVALALTIGWQSLRSSRSPTARPDEVSTPQSPSTPVAPGTLPAALDLSEGDQSAVDRGSDPLPFEDIMATVLPAVVSIETSRGVGSGFFIDRRTVVTNHHVLGVGLPTIYLSDGEKIQGNVWKKSEETDLAIIRVDRGSSDQPLLELGHTKDLRVGQEVYAVGSAMGLLENTVTRGIVSALRSVGEFTLIQTDAAINPGNSGGPLIDRNGRVVGITTLKVLEGESLGFAVAAQHVTDLLEGRDPAVFLAGSARGRGWESSRKEDYENTLNELVGRVAPLSARWDALWGECSDRASDDFVMGGSDLNTWSPSADTAFVTGFSTYTGEQRLYREVHTWEHHCQTGYFGIVRDVYSIVRAYDIVYQEYDEFVSEHRMLHKVRRQLPMPAELEAALHVR